MKNARTIALLISAAVAVIALSGCATSPSPSTGLTPTPHPTKSVKPDFVYLDLGDSNVYGDPGDCNACTTFPKQVVKALRRSSGKNIELLDGSQHNGVGANSLWSEILNDDWRGDTAGNIYGGPREAIAEADIISITVGANDVPWGNDLDPCNKVYDSACIDKIATPFGKSISGVLDEITTIRQGKPTAVRVTTYYNEVLAGPQYVPAWPSAAVAQASTGAKALIEAMNAGSCAAADAHGALCVDIYHAINGPDGLTPLPQSWFSVVGSDLLQAGQDFYAKQLLTTGWAPLTLD
jgi:hypothetical protein